MHKFHRRKRSQRSRALVGRDWAKNRVTRQFPLGGPPSASSPFTLHVGKAAAVKSRGILRRHGLRRKAFIICGLRSDPRYPRYQGERLDKKPSRRREEKLKRGEIERSREKGGEMKGGPTGSKRTNEPEDAERVRRRRDGRENNKTKRGGGKEMKGRRRRAKKEKDGRRLRVVRQTRTEGRVDRYWRRSNNGLLTMIIEHEAAGTLLKSTENRAGGFTCRINFYLVSNPLPLPRVPPRAPPWKMQPLAPSPYTMHRPWPVFLFTDCFFADPIWNLLSTTLACFVYLILLRNQSEGRSSRSLPSDSQGRV